MPNTIITNAGIELIAAAQAGQKGLNIDQIIFADVPGLDADDTPSASETSLPDNLVFVSPVGRVGRVAADTVVYSAILSSEIGNFYANWIGLYDSTSKVLVEVAYVPRFYKYKTVGSVAGNTQYKNMAIQFKNASAVTGIFIDAATWQVDGQYANKSLSNLDDAGRAMLAKHYLFEVFTSLCTVPPPGAYPLWTGEVLANCDVKHPAFWAKALEYSLSGDIRNVAAATYAAEVAETGSCLGFIIDTENRSIRLPKFTGYVRGIESAAEIGTVLNDAVQKIWGNFCGLCVGNKSEPLPVAKRGAFEITRAYSGFGTDGSDDRRQRAEYNFDVSRVVRTADETRPKTGKFAFYIQVDAVFEYAGNGSGEGDDDDVNATSAGKAIGMIAPDIPDTDLYHLVIDLSTDGKFQNILHWDTSVDTHRDKFKVFSFAAEEDFPENGLPSPYSGATVMIDLDQVDKKYVYYRYCWRSGSNNGSWKFGRRDGVKG